MQQGGELLVETVKGFAEGTLKEMPQAMLCNTNLNMPLKYLKNTR